MHCRLGCHAMHHAPLPPQSCSLAAVSAAMVSLLTGRRPPLAGEVTGVARPLRKWSSLPVREGMRGCGRGNAWEQERVRVGCGCASSTQASTSSTSQPSAAPHDPSLPAPTCRRQYEAQEQGRGLEGPRLELGVELQMEAGGVGEGGGK